MENYKKRINFTFSEVEFRFLKFCMLTSSKCSKMMSNKLKKDNNAQYLSTMAKTDCSKKETKFTVLNNDFFVYRLITFNQLTDQAVRTQRSEE